MIAAPLGPARSDADIGRMPPSASGQIPIANIYYLLCYAWEVLEEKDTFAEVDALESTDLLDLFARVLVNGVRRLLRRGLDRGYLPFEGEIAGARGKIQVSNTLRRGSLSNGRAVCGWDELDYDTLPNRILCATLRRLSGTKELSRGTRADVHDILRWFSSTGQLVIRSQDFRRVQLHRNNRIYGLLLHICEFIHEHWLPGENGRHRRFRDFVREALPKLFQNFVRAFYRREISTDWEVSAPKFEWRCGEKNDDARALLPRMETDVCLWRPGRAIIVDTKFYSNALKQGRSELPRLPTDNLYQIFTYLRQRSHEKGWEAAEGVLLYPRVDRDVSADFTTDGHRIRALTLDLARPWQDVHAALVGIVDSGPGISVSGGNGRSSGSAGR